jgi:hypothetical protein
VVCSGVHAGPGPIEPVRTAVTGRHRRWASLVPEVAIRVSTRATWNRATGLARPALDCGDRARAARSGSVCSVGDEPSRKVAVSVCLSVRSVLFAAPYARTSARPAR